MEPKVYKNTNGKVVGNMRDGVYRSKRSSSRHLHRVLDAWGIDTRILKSLAKDGCTEVKILDQDTMTVYATSLDTFITRGIEKDFGYGKQTFLQRGNWSVMNKEQRTLV